MPRKIALDTGPILAVFVKDDKYHAKALEYFSRTPAQFFTSLAVITEAIHLLDFRKELQRDLLRWIKSGAIEVVHQHLNDWNRIIELYEKYSDLPIDFADASLVAICERLEIRQVATIDGDFRIYRYRNRQSFENVFLDGG